jgi:hypothetical protein
MKPHVTGRTTSRKMRIEIAKLPKLLIYPDQDPTKQGSSVRMVLIQITCGTRCTAEKLLQMNCDPVALSCAQLRGGAPGKAA